MIHQISLNECLEPHAPPKQVLAVSALDDTAFVRICTVDQDSRQETLKEIAEISVSLPSLIEAVTLLAADVERENLRPLDHTGKSRETRLAGGRVTIAPAGPYAAAGAVTKHLRYTPAPSAEEAQP